MPSSLPVRPLPAAEPGAQVAPPRVVVLLATYNGMRWLDEQLASILGQVGVDVGVWVSDDGSTDGTWEWLERKAALDERVRLLPRVQPTGRPSLNFYRLIRDAGWAGADYVAFADQDDLWLDDKLSSHIAVLKRDASDGVSSNVIAFWPDGRRRLIDKSQSQRPLDFLFESPGPGCTFLMTPWLVSELKRVLELADSPALGVSLHDWLAYCVCRAAGRRWTIHSTPSVLYRQHDANSFGANFGLSRLLARLRALGDGWHRAEVARLTETALVAASPEMRRTVEAMWRAVQRRGLGSRMALLRRVPELRRRPRDRIALGVMIASGLW